MTSPTEDTGSGPYNPDEDPDADPGMIQPERLRPQPDQAEGEDEDSEDSEDFSAE